MALPLDPRVVLRAAVRAAQPPGEGSPATAADLVDVTSPDPGLFGPDSVAWRLHGDAATLIGGFRSLLLQALHPSVMAGVAQHSSFRDDPFGRLERTSRFVVATVYGTTADAERAARTVRRVHRRVRGTTADGTPYDAADPELVAFVHATEVDSFLAANRAYGRDRLDRAAADAYCVEMRRVADLLGSAPLPDTAAGTERWLAERRPDLRLTEDGRATVRFLLNPPLPVLARPAHAAVASAAVGLLPWWAQAALRLPALPPVDALVVRPWVNVGLAAFHWAFPPDASPLRAARAAAVTG
ncbi:MAG TPA: oxygenase MpaB family protein [Iamia sp.]|nr:oxygenase MpaB family protein [Iamia sp.]